jgi:hypothetical protein
MPKERTPEQIAKQKAQCKEYTRTHKKETAERNKLYRETHKDHIIERSYNYYHANKDKLIAINKEYRRTHKKEVAAIVKLYDATHRKEISANLLKLKTEVLIHYGNGKCACVKCGYSDIRALSIDHINGYGNHHRRTDGLGGGTDTYRWLKKNNYPNGYQTLCMNCQFLKKVENKEGSNKKRGDFTSPLEFGL